MDVDVVHRPEHSRFEAVVAGEPQDEVAFLSYEQVDGAVVMTHTIVPRHLEGHGIGGALAQSAVGWARGEGLEVEPQCSYVRAWLARHG